MQNTNNYQATNGEITLNGNFIAVYEFDRAADCFWIMESNANGQIWFNEKEEMINYFKK